MLQIMMKNGLVLAQAGFLAACENRSLFICVFQQLLLTRPLTYIF